MKVRAVCVCAFASVVSFAAFGGKGGPRPDLLAKVAAGELKEAHASWWGFDAADSTAFLQAAIDSGVRKLIVDDMGSPWVVKPIKGRSDQEIEFARGVELLAKRGEFQRKMDCLIAYRGASNVVLRGCGATFRMWVCDYTNSALYAKSEWRHAIGLWGVSNYRIEGLTLSSSGGDGIYFGSAGPGFPCRNGVVRNVVSERNNRQGMSIISAENLLIEKCVLRDTCGARPMAGIDIEPNRNTDVLKDIVIRDCLAEGNQGNGYEFEIVMMDSSSEPVSIRMERCVSRGNARACRIMRPTNPLRGFSGQYVFDRCEFLDEKQKLDEFVPGGNGSSSVAAVFSDCVMLDPKDRTRRIPVPGGWKKAEWPKDPSGRRLEQIPVDAGVLEGVKIVDAAPGRPAKTSALAFRGVNGFVFHAAKPGTVEFHGRMRAAGGRKLPANETKVIAELAPLVGGDARDVSADLDEKGGATIVCEVPRAGFWTLTVKSGNRLWSFEDTTVPLAACFGRGSHEPAMNGSVGELWLAVPKACSGFALYASGGGGVETVSARLCAPDGREVWAARDVGEWANFVAGSADCAPGLWKLVVERPGKGTLDDFSFDQIGIPLHFFLTPEKRWEW